MHRSPRRRALIAATAASATPLLAPVAAFAQPAAWPSKPLRIMVGAGAGGGTDIIARMLAEKLSAALGQQVLVENRPGASNTIAADLTAKAPADGHTLLAATNTGQAIAPHLIKLAFDPMKDVAPIALIVNVPNVLVVNPALPVKNVAELIAYAKSKPGEVKYASSGVGSTQHIAGEAFAAATGTKLVHVPYKGSAQAHLDLMSGQVETMFDTTSSAMQHIRSGKLRALALTTPKRAAELPDVPTLAEAGVSGAEMSTWYGLFVTGGTPQPVLDRLTAEVGRVLQMPDVQAKLRGLGGEPGTLTREQFAALNRTEYDRFGKLIRDAGIKLDQ
ncbi:MAG: tripartite tricarboxylate transporter substrate binding protein [Burkholderiales bacterium]|nr:MAG: tripartite tricarboxylate transporter substrate binding protein [Burkholderiales bacterium]